MRDISFAQQPEDLSFLARGSDLPVKIPFPHLSGEYQMWPVSDFASEEEGENFAIQVVEYLGTIQHNDRASVLRAITAAQIRTGVYSDAVAGYTTVIADHIDVG